MKNSKVQTGYRIIEIDELKKLYEANRKTVVVFGTWEYGRRVRRGLEGFGIKVSYFSDNNSEIVGQEVESLPVIAPENIVKLENPIVIVGSFWFERISRQLSEMGVAEVYALEECPVNSWDEINADRKELKEYFENYNDNVKNKILIEVYGHIGDVLVKTGVCKTLMSAFGKENVFFLVDDTEQRNIGEYLRLISNNIIHIEKEKFSKSREYRLEKLRYLNSQYFKFSYNLCDMRFHLKMRYVNKFILNIPQIYYAPEEYYVVDKDYRMLESILGRNVKAECEKNNNAVAEIGQIQLDIELPEKFIAINMGAANKMRQYPVEKFKLVYDYLIKQSKKLVFIGAGTYDEEFYRSLVGQGDSNGNVVSYINKLSLIESMAVINKCQYYIGLDSGMWNASVILEKLSIMIYGKGDLGHFKHERNFIHYVMSDWAKCPGCKYWDCPNELRIEGMSPCVVSIESGDIIEAIQCVDEELRGQEKKASFFLK